MVNAKINPEQVNYLNAHGTSTLAGDLEETIGIKRTFGDHASNLVVNSTKSMTGHLLGGAGGLESVVTVKNSFGFGGTNGTLVFSRAA
jgi:3-oxoacyl-[acyl-carrier-protein] synthase II